MRTHRNAIPLDLLPFFAYNPATRRAEPIADHPDIRSHGYNRWKIRGKYIADHRISWAVHHPENPDIPFVTFANGDAGDQSAENLVEGQLVNAVTIRTAKAKLKAEQNTCKTRLPAGIHHNPADDTYDVAYMNRMRLVIVGSGYKTPAEAAEALRIHRAHFFEEQVASTTFKGRQSKPEPRRTRPKTEEEINNNPEDYFGNMPEVADPSEIHNTPPAATPAADASSTPSPDDTPKRITRRTPEQTRAKMRDLLNGINRPDEYYAAEIPAAPILSIAEIEASMQLPAPTPAKNKTYPASILDDWYDDDEDEALA